MPDWVAAQEEFLSVSRMKGSELAPLVDARAPAHAPGRHERRADRGGRADRAQVQPRFTVRAPIGGVVTELLLREGMTVMAGATLARINGLGTVWANAEVPESQAALLRPGARVEATSPALPGKTFEGRVQAILPEVDATTRTLKARLQLANPGGRLVPGMFVQMQISDPRTAKVLLVPTEAIVQTGKRTVVMLAEDDGRFQPADVQIGIESGGLTEITRGLKAGQKVVVSAQFLIDSEASLRGIEARLGGASAEQALIARLIRWSIDNRFLVLIATAMLSAWGVVSVTKTPLDALPDLSDVQVIIRTSWPGQAPRHRREPGDLSADDDDAVGARREDGARLFVLRRLVRLCAVRRRHRSVLGALARARIPEPGAGAAAGQCQGVARPRCHRRRLDLPVRAGRPQRYAGRRRSCVRCRTGS